MQSWEYGEARSAKSPWKASRFVIEDENQDAIAIFQVLIFSFSLIGGVARINRGPLRIDTDISNHKEVNDTDIIKIINLEASKRRWRLFFIAPETEKNEFNHDALTKLGMRRRNSISWGSAIISLERFNEEDELLKSINGKWRNMLRKSQKLGLRIERYEGEESPIEILKVKYEELQSSKGFKGMSTSLLEEVIKTEGPQWKVNVYTATDPHELDENNLSGILVSITHGNTATYLIGYTSSEGRKNNANYLMLWNAILDAKREKVMYYDLGGLNENTPEGIARFKKGLNAENYELSGEFWS